MQSKLQTYEAAQSCFDRLKPRDYVLLDMMWRLHKLHGHQWFVFYSEDILMLLGYWKQPWIHYHINQHYKNVLQAVKTDSKYVQIRWHERVINSDLNTIELNFDDDLTKILYDHIKLQIPINVLSKPAQSNAVSQLIKYINKWNVGPMDQ